MAKKPVGTTAFKPTPPRKQTVSLSAADSAAPTPFPPDPPAAPTGPTGPTGGGGGGEDKPPAVDPDAYAKSQVAEAKRVRTKNAIVAMQDLMRSYGLESLMGVITGYVQDDYDDDAINALIRQTPEYKVRFPAMAALAAKNRVLSEAEYIAFETEASQMERAYGLPAGMLGKSTVTDLISNEVSVRELEERVGLAANGAYNATAAVKKQFKDYYGIDTGGLTAYFLDPQKALPLLNKQVTSAQIGAEAALQGIGVNAGLAENLTEAGITRDSAQAGFSTVAGMGGLSVGAGETVSQEELIKGTLLESDPAKQKMARVAKSKTGAFEGGGQFLQTKEGSVGLGSAATR